MGVPGFFMWLWKKYKGTNFVFNKEKLNPKKDSQLIKQLNSIDYFLIDTNCMIHPKCFAILDEYNDITNQERLEMKMINYVIEYLENVTKYVNPKKCLYCDRWCCSSS